MISDIGCTRRLINMTANRMPHPRTIKKFFMPSLPELRYIMRAGNTFPISQKILEMYGFYTVSFLPALRLLYYKDMRIPMFFFEIGKRYDIITL